MRRLFSFAFILAICLASVAQSDKTAWSNLNGTLAGQKILIVETNAQKHSGIFVTASESAVSFRTASGEMSIQRPNVSSIKLEKPSRRLRHILIGTGVGAGGGAATCAGAWSTTGWGRNGTAAAIGAGLGGVIGAGIGAAIPAHGSVIVYTAGTQ